MQILIDNKDLEIYFGIKCLDFTKALSLAAERENERTWHDKSGVDKNLTNIRYDAREFVLPCLVKESNEAVAYNLVVALVEYMFEKGCFVLSLRDSAKGIRECFLCERSSNIIPDINIRQQNSLYYFKLGLKDVNPNAVKYKNTIVGASTTILYDKGKWAVLYWGNGDRENVTNSGNYVKNDYSEEGLVDVIIDIDKNTPAVVSLVAYFSANHVSGVKHFTVQFTDLSIGSPVIWAWDFGDGSTSNEQNPEHTYNEVGEYTVTLQIFNSVNGSAVETKTNYIIVRNARILANDSGDFILANDSGDYILKN